MSMIDLTVKHGRTLDEARSRLELTVSEARTKFGPMIQRVDWAADRNAVTLSGTGFVVEIRVDDQAVHATGDMPLLGGLLGGPFASGLKSIVQQAFQKRLT